MGWNQSDLTILNTKQDRTNLNILSVVVISDKSGPDFEFGTTARPVDLIWARDAEATSVAKARTHSKPSLQDSRENSPLQ